MWWLDPYPCPAAEEPEVLTRVTETGACLTLFRIEEVWWPVGTDVVKI